MFCVLPSQAFLLMALQAFLLMALQAFLLMALHFNTLPFLRINNSLHLVANGCGAALSDVNKTFNVMGYLHVISSCFHLRL